MLLKVGYSGGQVRAIPLEPLKKALSKVWGSCFLDISQVDSNLFMAHFRTWEDLSWVWNKQPWSFGSDTFLMEWATADERIKPLSAYTFKSIMVTVRFYGVPMPLRSEDTARKLVKEIGEPSAASPILEENLKKDPLFMSVRVKIDVSKPVQAIVNLDIDNRDPLKVFVHYERIHRICTFCGLMFHNTQACPIKQRIIIQQKSDSQVQLADRYGKWITQLSYLPPEAMVDLERENKNSLVEKFRLHFANSGGRTSSSQEGISPVRSTGQLNSAPHRGASALVGPSQNCQQSNKLVTVQKEVEQATERDNLVLQQNIPLLTDGLPAADKATTQPSRYQLAHLARVHSENLGQPASSSLARKDKDGLYVIPAKKKLQFQDQMPASHQFQQDLNSIPLSSLHCLNHLAPNNAPQLFPQSTKPTQFPSGRNEEEESNLAGGNLMSSSPLKHEAGSKRPHSFSATSSAKRRAVGGYGDSGGNAGGGWTLDSASSAAEESGWSAWGVAAARAQRAPSPFSADAEGGDTASSQYRSSGGGAADGRSVPRREIKVRGRASRWDRGLGIGDRPQERHVWRSNVHLSIPSIGLPSLEAGKTGEFVNTVGDTLVGLEQADQKVDQKAFRQTIGNQEVFESPPKHYLVSSRSVGGGQYLHPSSANAALGGSSTPSSVSGSGSVRRGRMSVDDRLRPGVPVSGMGMELDNLSLPGQSAPAPKAPREP